MEIQRPTMVGNIKIIPFLSKAYITPEMERLRKIFRIIDLPTEGVGSSLGWGEAEWFAVDIFDLYRSLNSFAGFERSSLENFADYHGARMLELSFLGPSVNIFDNWEEKGYVRMEKIRRKQIVFPTEAFLDNQKVPRYP